MDSSGQTVRNSKYQLILLDGFKPSRNRKKNRLNLFPDGFSPISKQFKTVKKSFFFFFVVNKSYLSYLILFAGNSLCLLLNPTGFIYIYKENFTYNSWSFTSFAIRISFVKKCQFKVFIFQFFFSIPTLRKNFPLNFIKIPNFFFIYYF
jgi:hypothetical protein